VKFGVEMDHITHTTAYDIINTATVQDFELVFERFKTDLAIQNP